MSILKKIQNLSEPYTANETMKAANVLRFVELKLKGDLNRKIISRSGNVVQYEVINGPRINTAKVITRSENDSPKIYEYKFAVGDSVIVIGDMVHLPVDSTPSDTGSN
jgi:hypothetical protein